MFPCFRAGADYLINSRESCRALAGVLSVGFLNP